MRAGAVRAQEYARHRQSPIFIENQKQGTTDWQLQYPATRREIEGYASATSVAQGECIQLFVSTPEPSYTMEVYRMGWYGGTGGRHVFGPIERSGRLQADPVPDPITGLIECDWTEPYTLSIPKGSEHSGWPSGFYLAKLTASLSRAQSYILFVVRDDRYPSDLLFQSSVTTYQAYNNWGRKSLYGYLSPSGKADKVSFNRPYALNTAPGMEYGLGAAEFLLGGDGGPPAGWEYCTVRFLEREGYDVTYCTNIDVHANSALLLSHKAFLSVGHDEYWSLEMRRHVTAARERGVHLAFLGANACYWQIRMEPSLCTGAPHRTIVCYKYFPVDYIGTETRDPYCNDGDPATDKAITIRWRDALPGTSRVAWPEQELVGTMYHYGADYADDDLIVSHPEHWIFAQTGLVKGSRLPGLVGYECDRIHGSIPVGTTVLAESPYSGCTFLQGAMFRRIKRILDTWRLRQIERALVRFHQRLASILECLPGLVGESCVSHMTLTLADSGAMVFATGSMQWCWALDDWGVCAGYRPTRLNPAAQQMIRNFLARFADEEGGGYESG